MPALSRKKKNFYKIMFSGLDFAKRIVYNIETQSELLMWLNGRAAHS